MSASRPSYQTDERVDDYIDALPDWQQAICRELRDLIHAADTELTETIKRTVRPYFVLDGNVCALLAAKDHVNLLRRTGETPADVKFRVRGQLIREALLKTEHLTARALDAELMTRFKPQTACARFYVMSDCAGG